MAMQKFNGSEGSTGRWNGYSGQPDLFGHWKLVVFTARRTVGAG